MEIWRFIIVLLFYLIKRIAANDEDKARKYMEACAKQELFASVPPLNFTCVDKTAGGYYADVESGCHIFHLCAPSNVPLLTDHPFCCHPELVFDQRFLVCDRPENVACWSSTHYYLDQFLGHGFADSRDDDDNYSDSDFYNSPESTRQPRDHDPDPEEPVLHPPTEGHNHTEKNNQSLGKTVTLPPAFRHP